MKEKGDGWHYQKGDRYFFLELLDKAEYSTLHEQDIRHKKGKIKWQNKPNPVGSLAVAFVVWTKVENEA